MTAFTTPAATIDPVHDLAGNMTTMPQPKDATKKLDLKYDAWNRVVEVKNENGTVVTINEYDGLNRRIVRVETGGSGNLRHFYYNRQWQVLEEKVEVSGAINPNPLALYIYHPYYVDAIAKRYYDANTDGDVIDPGDGINYYLQDANFNVTAVTDNTGTVVERYAYTPYGEVTVLNPDFSAVTGNVSAISNELLYTGRRLDPETGLQLNRNRFYHAPLGRWVNRDPIGYGGGYNLYGYVGGQPTRYFDPLGYKKCKSVRFKTNTKSSPLFPSRGPISGAFKFESITEEKTCDITCDKDDCGPERPGQEITTSTTLKIKGSAGISSPGPASIGFKFELEGGGTFKSKYNSCTNEISKDGCGYIRGAGTFEGCIKNPVSKVCVKGTYWTRYTWCLNKPGEYCHGWRVSTEVCFLWRCYEFIMIEESTCSDAGGG